MTRQHHDSNLAGRGRNLTSHLTPGHDSDTRQLVRLPDDVAVARPGRIGRPRKRLDLTYIDWCRTLGW